MAGHPPRGRPPTIPAARSPHKACRPRGQCWAPTPTQLRPQHVSGGPQQPAKWADNQGRDSAGPQTPLIRWWKAPPPGDALPPPPQRATPARNGTRCGAGAGSPRPHRPHPGQTGRGTTRNGGRPPHPGTAPHHPRGTQPPQGMQTKGTVLGPHTHTAAPTAREWRTPTARQVGGQSGEGQRRTSDAPHPVVESTPPRGCPSATPTATNASPQGHTLWGRCRVPTPAPTAPGTDGSRNPSQRWQATPPRNGPPPPPRHAAPTGHACQGESAGPPHPHTRARSTWVSGPDSPPSGRAVGGGTVPDLSRPSQWWKAAPPGTPFCRPHSEQRRPARAHAVRPVLGPHARTDRTRDTRVAEPWPPAPEDRRLGEGQRLTPDAPHSGDRPNPRGRPPATPAARSPHRACRPKLGPHTHTPAPTARGWRIPTARPVGGRSGEGQRLTSDAPHNGGRHPPRGSPSAKFTASNATPQGRTLWGRCWVPTPAPTAPGTHGSRNPGCPLQRTGGPGRDSA